MFSRLGSGRLPRRALFLAPRRFCEPREVSGRPGGDGQDEEFGSFVGVDPKDFAFQGLHAAGGCFDEQEMFTGCFEFALPGVNRFDR